MVGGTGAWENSVKWIDSLAGKSWITWEIWNIPYFLMPSKETLLMKSPENLKLELDEKAIPTLEAHAMLLLWAEFHLFLQ